MTKKRKKSKILLPKEKDKQVEMIFRKLKDKHLSRELHELVGGWLLSEDSKEEKEREMTKLFDEIFLYSTHPTKEAYKSYNNFVRKHKLQYSKIKRHYFADNYLQKRLFRVAAVLALIMSISGNLYLLTEKVKDTVKQNLTSSLTVSVPADDLITNEGIAMADTKAITLPDNSTVIISKGSEIRYNDKFENKRHIELQGKARFNVVKAHSKDDSFTVQAEHLKINVLGTQFYVHSSAKESYSIIDLYHGSVEVETDSKTFLIKPTERLYFDHNTKQATIMHIPLYEITYDHMPGMYFEDMTLPQIFDTIRREYGAEIEITKDMSFGNANIRADLSKAYSLDQLMMALSKVTGCFTYEITSDKILVKPNNQ